MTQAIEFGSAGGAMFLLAMEDKTSKPGCSVVVAHVSGV